MYLNLFLLFVCINFGMGILTVAGTPLTAPPNLQDCFLDRTQVSLINDTTTAGSLGNSVLQAKSEFMIPKNNTETGSPIGATGLGPDNSEQLDQIEEFNPFIIVNALITMKNFATGGHIMEVVDNMTFQCDFTGSPNQYLDPPTNSIVNPDYNANYGQAVTPEVWNYFTDGVEIIVGILLVITLWYWISGKAHILSS